jgi:hypothetical protein
MFTNRKVTSSEWAVVNNGRVVAAFKRLSQAIKYRHENGGVLLSVVHDVRREDLDKT